MIRKQARICPRAELKWPVSAQISGGLMHGETKDISPAGAFIRCRKPLKLHEVFDMVINAPEKPLNVKAEVIWSNIYGYDDEITPRGMGVRFVKISDEDQKLIAQELNQYDVGKVACEFLDTLETDLA